MMCCDTIQYESNKTIWMFYENFDDEGDNQSIYIAERDNRLSHGPQPLTTGNVLKIPFFLAHLAFRPCELLPSLFVRHPVVRPFNQDGPHSRT